MSLSNSDCPNRYCEFCDTAKDVYDAYMKSVEEYKGRVPGYIDESN